MFNFIRRNIRAVHPMNLVTETRDSVPSMQNYSLLEPVLVRGKGNVIVFGMHNKLDSELPPKLISRVAPEEFKATVEMINDTLKRNLKNNLKWMVCGCVFICCTLCISLCPVLYGHNETKHRVHKLLQYENHRLYNKLGLNLSLVKIHAGAAQMIEYALLIEFLHKPNIYVPD